MSAAAMQLLVDDMQQRLGFWNLVQSTPFRDSYVAAQFARARGAGLVWIGADPPDFHLSGVPGCTTFEVVETFPAGRRRSDEYRRLAEAEARRRRLGDAALSAEERALFHAEPEPDDGEWHARVARAPALLTSAAAAKARKRYPPDWGLVVLLDLGGFVDSDEAVVASMQAGTEAAAQAFAEVWVVWHGEAYLTWRGGQPQAAARTNPA